MFLLIPATMTNSLHPYTNSLTPPIQKNQPVTTLLYLTIITNAPQNIKIALIKNLLHILLQNNILQRTKEHKTNFSQ